MAPARPDLRRLFRPAILRMDGYVPGEQPRKPSRVVKLNTNENPYPPSAAVRKALRTFDPGRLRLYPDPSCGAIRRRLAALHRWPVDGVLVSNGSDELLAMVFRATVGKGDLVQCPDLTYSLYPVLAAEREGRLREVPLREDFSLDPRALDPGARLTLLGYPNPPAGNLFPRREIQDFCRRARGLVVLDEAYGEFAEATCLAVARKNPNLVVLRTLSKSFSLAGLRLGYAFAHPAVAAQLHKVRDSYNVDVLTQAIAGAALSPAGLRAMETNVRKVRSERDRLRTRLGGLGLPAPVSTANFLLARVPRRPGARELARSLKDRGVLVRYFPFPRIADRLRITVGSRSQNDRLLGELRRALGR